MSGFAYVNGTIAPVDEAVISVRDRGFLYGDAAFETIRVYGGTCFAWDRHFERLHESCSTLEIEFPYSRDFLRNAIAETLASAGYRDAYVRLSITRGTQSGRLTPECDTSPSVVILTEPLPRGGVHGTPVWDGPATCTFTTVQRPSVEALPAHAKTHNYLNGILGRLEARAVGVDESLFLDSNRNVTEGATSNLFFVRDGTVLTPSVDDLPILPGITREIVCSVAERESIPVSTGSWPIDPVLQADEVFLTNSTWEIRPVNRIDETTFSSSTITDQLIDSFDELVENECY